MLIRSVGIKHFRSCEDVEVEVDELTAIVGANGCGKSAVLHALELFYAVNRRFSSDDFYAHDASKDIRITVTFAELTEEERRHFKQYLQGDTLTVTHVLCWRDGRGSHSLYGERLRFEGQGSRGDPQLIW